MLMFKNKFLVKKRVFCMLSRINVGNDALAHNQSYNRFFKKYRFPYVIKSIMQLRCTFTTIFYLVSSRDTEYNSKF